MDENIVFEVYVDRTMKTPGGLRGGRDWARFDDLPTPVGLKA